jgi:replication-associated recombination protein RarA
MVTMSGSIMVVIYGPPAAGKLTVGQALAELTGSRLFHNHVTEHAARALFDFGTKEHSNAV